MQKKTTYILPLLLGFLLIFSTNLSAQKCDDVAGIKTASLVWDDATYQLTSTPVSWTHTRSSGYHKFQLLHDAGTWQFTMRIVDNTTSTTVTTRNFTDDSPACTGAHEVNLTNGHEYTMDIILLLSGRESLDEDQGARAKICYTCSGS